MRFQAQYLCLVVAASSAGAFVAPRVALVSPVRAAEIVGPRYMSDITESSSLISPFVTETDSSNEALSATSTMEDPLVYATSTQQSKDALEVINVGILTLITAISLVLWMEHDALQLAMRIPMGLWSSYSNVLAHHPVETKAVTSATVYTIGDILAQKSEGAGDNLDHQRALRSLMAGLIGHGPLSHIWYNVSEHLFHSVLHWTAWWAFIPKVILDQGLWSPIWNNTYIILLGLFKQDSPETMWGDIKRTTIPLVVSGLKLWPLAHCVTYGLIPVENRLLWVDTVEILWVSIMSTQAAGKTHSGQDSSPVDTAPVDSGFS